MHHENLLYQFLYWLPAIILACLIVLYLRGVARAYRAAGDGWKRMDPDVRLVFILAVPLFRAGIHVLLLIDRLFYAPRTETMTKPRDDAPFPWRSHHN
jgi:hypothetical protein